MTDIPALRKSFDALAAALRDHVGDRPIIFMINPGNWGDSLIRAGAEKFLTDYKFRFTIQSHRDILGKRATLNDAIKSTGSDHPAMLYNGSGLFSGKYRAAASIAELAAQFEVSAILPSSYAWDVRDQGFPDHTLFFARDRYDSLNNLPGSIFCHDMAFFLKPDPVPIVRTAGYFFRRDRERPEGQYFPPWQP